MAIDLTILSMQLNRYVLGSTLFFGIIGSIANTLIFSQKNMRRFPCSLYYLTQSIVCLLLLCTIILLRDLAEAYQIDLAAHSLYTCKFFLYASSIFRSLSALFILWSAVDRYLASSSSERLRKLSQVKYSIYIICLTIIITTVLFIYVPIYFGDSSILSLTCTPNGHGILTLAHNLLNALILALFVPSMLIFLSILTFKNVQRRRQLVHTTNTASQQRQNAHMIRLMLCQSLIYLILVTPSGIFNFYSAFISLQTNAQLVFTYKLLFMFQYVHAATAFYVNTLVCRTYRQEVLKILNKVVKRLFHSTMVERHILKNEQPQQRQNMNFNTKVVRQMETKF